MRNTFRRILGVLAAHLLLSGVVLAGLRVWQSGYNRTHRDQVQTASLRVTGDTAELSVLNQTYRIPLPENSDRLLLSGYLLADDATRLWVWVLSGFQLNDNVCF